MLNAVGQPFDEDAGLRITEASREGIIRQNEVQQPSNPHSALPPQFPPMAASPRNRAKADLFHTAGRAGTISLALVVSKSNTLTAFSNRDNLPADFQMRRLSTSSRAPSWQQETRLEKI
jgi:hypothetical protein